ncbi:uncharacterized protein LOC114760674 [Neltuma alba]|uniref:uncharacterized protein LOC114760674 n=1 Tax=Neltuma alba TaxID=207710 RepID=UPI0010A43CEA|nr:uncharacterized protein LOC114760674 [Prosopis alba]
MAAATDQDFSFPTINDSYSFSIDSPPLWNLSPATSPNPYGGLIRESQRKSFSCIEIGRPVRNEEEQEDEEKQKMDLLWEDFNEELSSSRANGSSSSSSREQAEFRTVSKRRNSYDSDSLIVPSKNGRNKGSNNNKPGMVVLVKVLKKLFSVNNSLGKPRKRVT